MKFVLLVLLAVTLAAANAEKIVGGTKTDIANYPWQISLRSSGSHICGGSIYNEQWIITAAHCVYGGIASRYTILTGSSHRQNILGTGAVHQVEKIVIHPNYNSRLLDYDIALLKISTKITFDSNTKAVKLNTKYNSDQLIGKNCHVTGWGTLSPSGSIPVDLYTVTLPIITRAESNYTLATNYNPLTMMIAGRPGEGKDSCQGDSGGPLVVDYETGEPLLTGLTSWGYSCGWSGVYTLVSFFVDWVLAQIFAS